jgi:hypothetical protein
MFTLTPTETWACAGAESATAEHALNKMAKVEDRSIRMEAILFWRLEDRKLGELPARKLRPTVDYELARYGGDEA